MKVTVVIPAYNEEELLSACLDSLARQDYPGPIEIVVVDNGSTDGTAHVARSRGARVVSEPERGYSRALATGFAAATGEILASTDADTVVPTFWISRLVREFERRPEVVAVGGEIVFCEPNLKARLFTRGLLPLLSRADRRCPEGPHLWGANLSVRRSVFEAAGGLNLDFNLQVDTELSERLRAYGRVVLLEDVPVYTSSRRWNRMLMRSLFLYATNFVSLELRGRPLWREFPAIREERLPLPANPRRAPGPLAWVASVAAAMLVGIGLYDAVSPWSGAFGATHWTGHQSGREIALTFDDGPNEPYTSEVLAILRREHVRATFFLIGERVRREPGAAAEIVREGHVVGNHSETHPFALALEPASRIRAELDRAERQIHAATGVYPRLFRPPQGLRSPWLMRVAEADSLDTVTWDDSAVDWNPLRAQQLVDRIVAAAHPGAIILLHDGLNLVPGADRGVVVAGLTTLIGRLRAEGYRFVTVPELLGESSTLPRWPASASRLSGAAVAQAAPGTAAPMLPEIADVPVPGPPVRFDYQSIDTTADRLYVSYMNAGKLLVFDLERRRVEAEVGGLPRATGVCAVPELGKVYVSVPGTHQVAILDARTSRVVSRVGRIGFPDGIAYAPTVGRIYVSDESGGGECVIDGRSGRVVDTIAIGGEAGNSVYDPGSGHVLVAVQSRNEVIAIDPRTDGIVGRHGLEGADRPHGMSVDAADRLLFVANEGSASLLTVDLRSMKVIETHRVGGDPDVLAFDPPAGRLYVASESGVVSVFARHGAGLVEVGRIVAPHAHTVSVDPRTHQVYLPLQDVGGHPVLRILDGGGPAGLSGASAASR